MFKAENDKQIRNNDNSENVLIPRGQDIKSSYIYRKVPTKNYSENATLIP